MGHKRWLALTLILGLSLSGSVLINGVLFTQTQKYYLELNQTRLDPFGLERYAQTVPLDLEEERDRLVLLGDSRAAAWQVTDIEEWLNTQNYSVFNRGINSQTTAKVLQRFDAHVRPLQPTVVVLQVGINDLKTVALFPSRRQDIVADCQRNIAQIVNQAQQLGATVIITTIFPVGDVPIQRQPFWSNDIAQAVLEVNTSITALAAEDVKVLDAFGLLVDDRGMMQSTYQLDELHVNQAAYGVLNQALMQQLSP